MDTFEANLLAEAKRRSLRLVVLVQGQFLPARLSCCEGVIRL